MDSVFQYIVTGVVALLGFMSGKLIAGRLGDSPARRVIGWLLVVGILLFVLWYEEVI